jgi:hypothetical protein
MRWDETQPELFLLLMAIQLLIGECKAYVENQGFNQEWEVIEAAIATILNFESFLSITSITTNIGKINSKNQTEETKKINK